MTCSAPRCRTSAARASYTGVSLMVVRTAGTGTTAAVALLTRAPTGTRTELVADPAFSVADAAPGAAPNRRTDWAAFAIVTGTSRVVVCSPSDAATRNTYAPSG